MTGCEGADLCTADLFIAGLEAKIGYDDLDSGCNGTSFDPFIQ